MLLISEVFKLKKIQRRLVKKIENMKIDLDSLKEKKDWTRYQKQKIENDYSPLAKQWRLKSRLKPHRGSIPQTVGETIARINQFVRKVLTPGEAIF